MVSKPPASVSSIYDKLIETLLSGAFISKEQLQQAQEVSRKDNKKLHEALVDLQFVTPETISSIIGFQFNVPVVDLQQYSIQPQALQAVPAEVARENNVLPIAIENDVLKVALDDPLNLRTLEAVARVSRMRVRPVLPLRGGVKEMISRLYKDTGTIERELRQAAEVQAQAPARVERAPALDAEAVAQAPVVRSVDMIIAQAVKDRASDIHIIPAEQKLKILYRIDGVLHDMLSLPLGVHQAILSRIKVQANMNIAERRRPQDGAFVTKIGGNDINFRIATAETQYGEMAVLRVLDKSVSLQKMNDLGMQTQPLQSMQSLLNSPYGMVMVSGPTGAGKTTTLYAALNSLIGQGKNIMTVEDPVEYHFEGVNQIQVNRQADITFATGLRAIMRLDPDIILVGEIRDAETANIAVQAALTGHLVLTTIHANTAAAALVRLIDMGIEPFLATSAIVGSIAQRLVRRVCPYCRASMPIPPAEAAFYQKEMQEPKTEFFVGRGCNFCSNTGHMGRLGVFEILVLNEKVRSIIARGGGASEIQEQAAKDGMVTMRRDGLTKARDGLTTVSEVIRNVFTIE